jgi:ABC-type methionine transport system permease subunit
MPEKLGVIVASFALAGVVAGGGATEVTIKTVFVVENKTTFTLLLVMVVVVPIVAAIQA